MKDRVKLIFTALKAANPNPTTELVYHSEFELLVAVVLSAQATDVSVNKALSKLFVVANTPKGLCDLGVVRLEQYIKTIGLYKTKAKNVIALSKELIANYDAKVPASFAELIKLPGVGRKTANVILNTLFREPTIAVDTHVFRVSNRLGIAKGKTPEEVEAKLLKIVPEEFRLDAHHWLILHGRYTCKARAPLCAQCKLTKYCDYWQKVEALT